MQDVREPAQHPRELAQALKQPRKFSSALVFQHCTPTVCLETRVSSVQRPQLANQRGVPAKICPRVDPLASRTRLQSLNLETLKFN
jgi:hypothetical protein